MQENVFSVLATYSSNASENYLTEAFVFVLKLLLDRCPQHGLIMLNRLCGSTDHPTLHNNSSIRISTQVTVEQGRPDIEIRDGQNFLAYVEVKHDAPLSIGQLEYYQAKLQQTPFPHTRLVLLTRSRLSARETTLLPHQYQHVCWYEIHNWFAHLNPKDEICTYFIDSFIQFLEEKNMHLKKVTWEYMQGVPAMLQLSNIMEAALIEVLPTVKFKRTGGWSWRGFYLADKYFCGVRYDRPLFITFENNGGNMPTYKRELDLEQVHFFSLTADEQFRIIAEFLQQAFINAQQFQTEKNDIAAQIRANESP